MPRSQRTILIAVLAFALGYAWLRGAFVFASGAVEPEAAVAANAGTATFAAGCFWSAESAFEGLPGVLRVTAGYTGGTVVKPTYEQVSAGATGHAEAVEIRFDPARVTYSQLLDHFWHQVDLFAAHRSSAISVTSTAPRSSCMTTISGRQLRRHVATGRNTLAARFLLRSLTPHPSTAPRPTIRTTRCDSPRNTGSIAGCADGIATARDLALTPCVTNAHDGQVASR